MDWNDIPYFLAVADSGSLNGAAAKLDVNHSTVFRRINTLEDKLGMRLFDRLPTGYALTEEGFSVLCHAQQAERSIHSFERSIAGKDEELSGNIRISMPPTLATKYLSPCIADFHELHPGIRITVIATDTRHDLSRREADMALRATNNPPEYLLGRKIKEFNWHVYASKDYLEKHGTPKSMQALKHHRLIAAEEPIVRLEAFRWFTENYPSENFVCSASEIKTITTLCAAGLGIAVLPTNYSHHELVKLFKIKPEFKTALWILTHTDLRQVARIRIFSDFICEYLKQQEL